MKVSELIEILKNNYESDDDVFIFVMNGKMGSIQDIVGVHENGGAQLSGDSTKPLTNRR
jgi:hypothetical protein